jgi:hypothetical protein
MTVGGASVPTTNYLGRDAIVGSTAGLPGLVLPAGLTRGGHTAWQWRPASPG